MQQSANDADRPSAMPPEHAATLIARWDRVQDRYAIDRSARSEVVADLVAVAAGGEGPGTVLDLGCGPGSLTRSLADRVRHLEVVGVDADPLLLALGRAALGDHVRLVEAHVGSPGWIETARPSHPVVAVVASAVFHYPARDELAHLYTELAGLLPPGGLLVSADHLVEPEQAGIASLRHAATARSAAAAAAGGLEWGSWWAEVAADPWCQAAVGGSVVAPALDGDNDLTAADHVDLLRIAGFAEVGEVWRHGPSAVLVAVR